jgi:hypothetical protein
MNVKLLVGRGSILRTFRAGNRRSDVAVDAHHATCISVYGVAVDLVLGPCFVCRRYRIRAAEQLLQPIAEHDGNHPNGGVVIDKEPSPRGDARGVGQCSGMSPEAYCERL